MQAIIFDWGNTIAGRDGPYPYTKNVLAELAGSYRLGLITIPLHSADERMDELRTHGLAEYFTAIRIPQDKTIGDFVSCMREMQVIPKDTYVVGDNLAKEIAIGNQMGCTTVWVYGDTRHKEGIIIPSMRIPTIETLLESIV